LWKFLFKEERINAMIDDLARTNALLLGNSSSASRSS